MVFVIIEFQNVSFYTSAVPGYMFNGSLKKKLPSIYPSRKWQDYVYIQCEYKSTKQKIKHLLREENKVKENKIS